MITYHGGKLTNNAAWFLGISWMQLLAYNVFEQPLCQSVMNSLKAT